MSFKDFPMANIKWSKTRNTRNEEILYIDYNNCHIQFNKNYSFLSLSTSITKFLYGENNYEFDFSDLNRFYENLNFILRILIKEKLPNVKTWSVSRLDLVANFSCENSTDKNTYVDLTKKLNYSHCKLDRYETSIHAHNKSFCYNYYNKNTQCNYDIPEILRLEHQFKNRSIYNFLKNNTFKNKTLEVIMSNSSSLNYIYKSRLRKVGLDKKFLTSVQMAKLLKQLRSKNTIGITKFNNMYNYFINNSISISNNTLNNYKHILAKYNCSHITIDNKVSKEINFMNFSLFTNKKIRTFSKAKLILKILTIYIILNLGKEESKTTSLFIPISKNNNLLKLIFIIDDS